jgi:hypothetical protein
VATIVANTLTIRGIGSTTITATQMAKGNYGTNATSASFTVTSAP